MDFEKEVLEGSKQKPILVDFWAPWCGPCQVLGPILEELEQEQEQKKWKLVKVNTDENPEISAKYGIRGIPDVRLFIDGKEVNRFSGAIPKFQVEKWLADNIPDERLAVLESLEAKGSAPEHIQKLDQFVIANPDFVPGFVALAKVILWSDPQRALDLLDQVKLGGKYFHMIESTKELASFLTNDLGANEPVVGTLKIAQEYLRKKEFKQALESLIESVVQNKGFQDELPRRATVALFVLLGPEHELTKAYRKRFDMALY